MLFACSSSTSTTPAPVPGPVDVTTDKGVVHGSAQDGARSFLGIPFAAPPIGSARFRPPQDAAPWSAPLDATHYGPMCAQLLNSGVGLASDSAEDCLTLNVWTPETAVRNAPVMVWIHGGGFVTGSGSEAMYNGTKLAQKSGAIVVSFNYRLGALGFVSYPAIAAEQGVPTLPSPGLLDQQAALRWVQRNIASFGGDPTNVTLFGESAGGMSTCAHLAMPASKGLFAHAIIESGPCFGFLFVDKATAADQGDRLAKAVGCTDPGTLPACLRSKAPEELLMALPLRQAFLGMPGDVFGPAIDGVTLPKAPYDALVAGEIAKVPTILGTNLNEGQSFLKLYGKDPTPTEARAILDTLVGKTKTDAVAARYPIDTSTKQAMIDVITDGVFTCGARRAARALRDAGVTTFRYQFTYPYSFGGFSDLVASHGFEIPFVFGNGLFGTSLNDEQLGVFDTMEGYWSRFAATGQPNASGATTWPSFGADEGYLAINAPPVAGKDLKREVCDFLGRDLFEPLTCRARAFGPPRGSSPHTWLRHVGRVQ